MLSEGARINDKWLPEFPFWWPLVDTYKDRWREKYLNTKYDRLSIKRKMANRKQSTLIE